MRGSGTSKENTYMVSNFMHFELKKKLHIFGTEEVLFIELFHFFPTGQLQDFFSFSENTPQYLGRNKDLKNSFFSIFIF